MKIENEFYDYYQRKIDEVEIPAARVPSELRYRKRPSIKLALTAAAVIIISFMPFIYRINTPPVLAVRAASFSEYYQLDSRIRNGLLEIREIASYSSISGGKK